MSYAFIIFSLNYLGLYSGFFTYYVIRNTKFTVKIGCYYIFSR